MSAEKETSGAVGPMTCSFCCRKERPNCLPVPSGDHYATVCRDCLDVVVLLDEAMTAFMGPTARSQEHATPSSTLAEQSTTRLSAPTPKLQEDTAHHIASGSTPDNASGRDAALPPVAPTPTETNSNE